MLVIFDCDGVLVESERIVNRVEAEFLSSRGWPLDPQQARALFKGHTFAEVLRLSREHIPGGVADDWVYELGMATALALHRELAPVAGVTEVLETLRRASIPVCVASQSVPSRVRLSLRLCGLEGFFGKNVFSASMVARPKPAPDLFLHAAATLGVRPEACTVIEDSPTGVRAAVSAGMRVFGYAGDEDPEALAQAGAITFTHMAELPHLLGLTRPSAAASGR
ncbi:MAG: HAD family hydrolase [Pseudomonadota bacterium]|nr:MAG: HAD family hydrolase [Pseudomonadota bacterium]